MESDTTMTDDEFSDAIKQLDLRAELAEMKKQRDEARGLYLQRNYHREQLERELAAAKAELVSKADELAAMRGLVAERDGYLEGNKQTLRALEEANEIAKRYKHERDEARREVCRLLSKRSGIIGAYRSAKDYAAERGWLLFGGGA